MSIWPKICNEFITMGKRATKRPWYPALDEDGKWGIIESPGDSWVCTSLHPNDQCDMNYIAATANNADRVARFAKMLAADHGYCSFISIEEQEESVQQLWEESK